MMLTWNEETERKVKEAVGQTRKDLQRARTKKHLWAEAVRFLAVELERDKKVGRAREAMKEHGLLWAYMVHFTIGRVVRNKLRTAGFGESAFGVSNLDNVWAVLVEEAVKEAS